MTATDKPTTTQRSEADAEGAGLKRPYRPLLKPHGLTLRETTDWMLGQCVSVPSGCMLWPWHRQKDGYAHVRFHGKMVLGHRLVWEALNGPISDDQCVCHRCDTPPCLRPEHHFLGTQVDNIADMNAKGRHVVPTVLTQEEATMIREMYSTGNYLQRELAKLFGIAASHVSHITTNRAWVRAAQPKHDEGEECGP